MEIIGFDSNEEMMAYLAGQNELAESLTFPWQRELKVGDYVVGFADDGEEAWGNYGQVVEGPTEDMPNYTLVSIYNRLYPDHAQLEAPRLCTWSGKLIAQYKLCQKAGWPATNWEMFRTIHPHGAALVCYSAPRKLLLQRILVGQFAGPTQLVAAWVGELNGRWEAHYAPYGKIVARHGQHSFDDNWALLVKDKGSLLRWAQELERPHEGQP